MLSRQMSESKDDSIKMGAIGILCRLSMSASSKCLDYELAYLNRSYLFIMPMSVGNEALSIDMTLLRQTPTN